MTCKYCKFLVQIKSNEGVLVDTCCFHNEVSLTTNIDCALYTEDERMVAKEAAVEPPKKKRTKKCSKN